MRKVMTGAMLLLASCRPGGEAPEPAAPTFSPSDRDAVGALSEAYGRAWIAGDTAAVMEVFAPDAVLVPHLGNPEAAGLAAIREHFFPAGSPPVTVIRYDRRSTGVQGAGDLAWDRGRYDLAMVFEGDTLRSAGNYVAIAGRQPSGGWRWVAYTWNHP